MTSIKPPTSNDAEYVPVDFTEMSMPCLVLDIETVSLNTSTETIFDIAIGMVNDIISDNEHERFCVEHIKRTLVKPDMEQADVDTVNFHHEQGHYTLADIDNTTGIAASELIPWITNAIHELYTTFNLAATETDSEEEVRAKKRVQDSVVVYARHPEFDMGFLTSYCRRYNQEVPWKYWQVWDLATVTNMCATIYDDLFLSHVDRDFAVKLIAEMKRSENTDHKDYKTFFPYVKKHTAFSDTAWEMKQAAVAHMFLRHSGELVESQLTQIAQANFIRHRIDLTKHTQHFMEVATMNEAYDDPKISSTTLN